jgi:hypothetical protein
MQRPQIAVERKAISEITKPIPGRYLFNQEILLIFQARQLLFRHSPFGF